MFYGKTLVERWTKVYFHPVLTSPINVISESIDVAGEASDNNKD